MMWWAVGASLFCSNIGSEHFVGLAGTAAKEGIAVGWNEWTGIFMILVLAYIFVPIYFKTLVFTTPEYIEKRYNKHLRTYLAILSLVIYIFTKISVSIFAGALVMEVVLGWNQWISAAVMLIFTGLYTVLGGMSAVIWTEVLQTVILLVGGITISIICFTKVGGLPFLISQRPDLFHLFRPADDVSFPWTAVVFGMPVINLWYWCTDQVMVQRAFSAKNEGHAKTGSLLAAALKIPMMFILVMPGTVAGYLYPLEVARDSNTAFPLMVKRLMPPAVKGLMISAMLAAAMSTLASVFNSASTIFTMDIYQKFRTESSQRELVWVGRIGTLTLCVLSVAWIPFIRFFSDQLFVYLTSITSYTAPPIAAVYLMGILWDGTTSLSAYISLSIGFILGILRFVLEIGFRGKTGRDSFWFMFVDLNYMNFGFLLFAFSIMLLISVSILTPHRWRPDKIAIKYCVINYENFFRKSFDFLHMLKKHKVGINAHKDVQYTLVKTPENDETSTPSPDNFEDDSQEQDLDMKLAQRTATAIEGWHKWSWTSVPVLLIIMLVLIIIFR
jgi:SSS family solute:Na+ symporter